jgi:hypothetical protein
MVDHELPQFAKILLAVADYYGKELSENVVDLYWNGLREYDLAAVQKALWAHVRNPDTGQFMPKIADVARALQGRTDDQAAVAWSKVDQAVRRVGTYQCVVFDDPIVHRVLIDMGGWVYIGAKDEKEWPFVAKEFQNRYRGYRMRDETPEYPPVMIGLANAHNSKTGFRENPPILIGDERKAHQVRMGGTTAPLLGMKSAADVQLPSAEIHQIADGRRA